jgi:hypothetical protein
LNFFEYSMIQCWIIESLNHWIFENIESLNNRIFEYIEYSDHWIIESLNNRIFENIESLNNRIFENIESLNHWIFESLNIQKHWIIEYSNHWIDFLEIGFLGRGEAGGHENVLLLSGKWRLRVENGSEVGKSVFFDTYANYRRKRARRLKFWLLIEDEWNLIVSEDEVDRIKTLGFMAMLLQKN